MAKFSKELIQNTIELWSPKAGYRISEEEAIEIILNLSRFFEGLNDIANSIENDLTNRHITPHAGRNQQL